MTAQRHSANKQQNSDLSPATRAPEPGLLKWHCVLYLYFAFETDHNLLEVKDLNFYFFVYLYGVKHRKASNKHYC